jgi:ferredoxin
MNAMTDKIRQIARRLLEEGKVDMVVGFRKGTVPMMSEPCFIKDSARVDALVWDGNCGINLANYLTRRKERMAVVAKGCDTRNIVTHIIENQIRREQVYIIGVPCQGMIDKRKVKNLADGEVLSVEEKDGKVVVTAGGGEKSFDRTALLQDNCAICHHKNPALSDELAGELVRENPDVDRYEDVRKVEAMGAAEKWKFFDELLSTCIRCYACRNACPLCYCPTCFVDESKPQWVGKGQDPTDTRTFHFLRAFHCAGRCTDCGSCERACPMGIPVRQFTKKLEKDAKELFGWEAGMTLDARPPLDTFRPDDPGAFIK